MERKADHKKEFKAIFNKLCHVRPAWQVWSDLMAYFASGLAMWTEPEAFMQAKRKQEYERCETSLGGEEIPTELFTLTALALREQPQDFLGQIFMELGLSDHWKGQFFTPYCISKMMAMMAATDKQTEEYEACIDPACGAGAMLIAKADLAGEDRDNMLLVGQDISRVAAQMCFVQLSLLGCAGYVVVGDTLANPVIGHPLFPQQQSGQEFYYTLEFFGEAWEERRAKLVAEAEKDAV